VNTVNINIAEFELQWRKLHGGYERYGFKLFRTALKAQVAPVLNHIKRYGSITPELADYLVSKQPVETAYRDLYLKIGVRQAAYTRRWINSVGRSQKGIMSFFSEKWSRLMQAFFTDHAAQRVSDVTETTREKIRKALSDSADMTLSEQATYLEDTLGSDGFTRYRAMMISRTETTTAANCGAALGNEDADYLTAKQWLSILDNNTRPNHVDANGQQVENTDYFIVGGYQCMYPGDMSLPANEVINCRCTTIYVPILSASGLPILKAV